MLLSIRKGIRIFLTRPALFLSLILTYSILGTMFTIIDYLYYKDQLLNFYFIINQLLGMFTVSVCSYASVKLAQGVEVNYFEVIREGSRKWDKILITYFILYLSYIIGVILLLIPGVIAAVRFAQVPMVLLFEEVNLKQRFKRSIELTKGYGIKIFGLFILVMLVAVPLSLTAAKLKIPSIPIENFSVLFNFIACHFFNIFILGFLMVFSINVLTVYYLEAIQRESLPEDSISA